MPAATTHTEFSKDVYNILDATSKQKITNMQMYYVGSQGPDLLFFSGFSVLPSSMVKIGNRMHDVKCNEVMAYFDKYATDDPDLLSYFCGFLTHYAIDATVHPLVCALAKEEAKRTGRKNTEVHFKIESVYDCFTLRRKGRSPYSYNVYKHLRLSQKDCEKLAKLYQGMLKEVYDEDITLKRLERGIKDAYLMTRLLKPSKLKYFVCDKIENMTGSWKMVTSLMLSDHKDESYLNEQHRVWHPEFAPMEERYESFMDLYREAMGRAARIIHHHSESDFVENYVGEHYL